MFAGCQYLQPAADSDAGRQTPTAVGSSGGPTQAPPALPIAQKNPSMRVPEGVVGTGTLLDRSGTAVGSFTLHANVTGGGRLEVTELSLPHEVVTVNISFGDRSYESCADGVPLSFGEAAPATVGDAPMAFGGDGEDWTYYAEVDITADQDRSEPDLVIAPEGYICGSRIVARGVIEWAVGPARTDLDVVTDAGARSGAKGSTTVDEDGRLVAYEVASGDTLEAVLDRFGLTRDDLSYLNPMMISDGYQIWAGERYNLDLHDRNQFL